MTVKFLQMLKWSMKMWCQHMYPDRAFKRQWMLYATQPVVCPIQKKTNRCVSFWKNCFLQSSQGARRFRLDPVCLALPFLIVIWISFLIQVIVLLQHANGHSPLFSTEISTVQNIVCTMSCLIKHRDAYSYIYLYSSCLFYTWKTKCCKLMLQIHNRCLPVDCKISKT